MIKKEISLSEVADYFKKNNIPSFEEDIDEFGSYFITAGRIVAMILAPNPITVLGNFCAGLDAASLRASKLFSWLPDKFKYGKKGREKFAIQRYELSSIISYLLLQVAIKDSLKEHIIPVINQILQKTTLDEAQKKELKKLCEASDKEIQSKVIPSHSSIPKEKIEDYAYSLVKPILPCLLDFAKNCKKPDKKLEKIEINEIKEKYIERIYTLYNAFLINFSAEFPNFALWVDFSINDTMIKEINSLTKSIQADRKEVHKKFTTQLKKLSKNIEKLESDTFSATNGFPTFTKNYKSIFQTQIDKIDGKLTERVRENIEAHQNQIKSELNKPLSDNEDIEGIVFPKNRDIYISQCFEAITYKRKSHKKGFLTSSSLGNTRESGEDIGNYLLKTLVDPNFVSKPIIILGNPGAGKSMLSKMFAGELCATNDFLPFLIRLRDVASSSANISEHINKGLALSIENMHDVNWLDWAKEFKERSPVIIMDGFDELMQSSSTELNGYITTIKEFQEKALHHNICVRIILTSRVAVMQDVTIPEGTRIIKLKSFDSKRQKLWVENWNSFQTKENYTFRLPKKDKIQQLAQEPLLIFMLAVYDFEKSELQKLSRDKNFNQSKLYDSLLNEFADRQLQKNSLFLNADSTTKKKEKELFRLRLGMIALMMFLNDTTHRDTHKLKEELEAFKLHKSQIQTSNILGGFFFVHENKSVTEGDIEQYNYEFLHKTFAEFLAADFLLRVALMQCERSSRDESIFRFCYGYNWLHKHHNIQNFLFEYGPQLVTKKGGKADYIINEIIIPDLEKLFDKISQSFPVTDFRLLPHRPKIEHLAIYSQNLIFLWGAINKKGENIKFQIFNIESNNEKTEFKFKAQDRDEVNKNKLSWKRMTKLWSLVSNHNATAKLSEWINVCEEEDTILLSKKQSEVQHNFSTSSRVSCNDYEFLLSLFDNEYKFSNNNEVFDQIINIIKRKPEFERIGIDAILYRFFELSFPNRADRVINFLIRSSVSRRQQELLLIIINKIKWRIDRELLFDIIHRYSGNRFLLRESSPNVFFHYLKLLIDSEQVYSIIEIFNRDQAEDLSRKVFESFKDIFRDEAIVNYEYLKLLNDSLDSSFLSKILSPKTIEELIYIVLRKTEGKNPEYSIEFLRIISKSSKNVIKYRIDPRILKEVFHNFSEMLDEITQESSRYSFYYLNVITELGKHFPINKFIKWKPIKNLMYYLIKEIEYDRRNIYQEFEYNRQKIFRKSSSHYLEVISELSKYYPVGKILPSEFFKNIVYSISEELRHLHQDNSKTVIHRMEFIINAGRYKPIEKIIPTKLLEELLHRSAKSILEIFQDNPQLAFRIMNLIEKVYGKKEGLQIIYDSMPELRKKEISNPELLFELSHFYSKLVANEKYN